MRVIVANKFWYRRAGLERVMIDEVSWLEAEGHEVAHFSTTHPLNDPSPWSSYFVPYVELGQNGGLSPSQKLRAAGNMFYNRGAAARFDRLISDFEPDVIHIHGIHRQVSPSILGVARRRGVPVVQTLHDYHHVCPCDVLLRRGEELCDPRHCKKYWYGGALTGRCVRGSLPASALSAAETAYARAAKSYERGVSRFISPSRFLADVMTAGGWRVPVDLIPNAVPVEPMREGAGDGFVVIGRLRGEKGVEVALQAARVVGVPIVVAGEGPLGDRLRADFPEATFTGHLGGEEVAALVRRARAVVMPSLWFENASMTVLEAMAAGVPVVGSRIGGIPEQITDGVDGVLVVPGEVEALAEALSALATDPGLATMLGAAARETIGARFSPEEHISRLVESYRLAMRAG